MKSVKKVQSKKMGLGLQAGQAPRLVGVSGAKGLQGGAAQLLPVPDLLHLEPRISPSADAVHELLELAFHGKEAAKGLERKLAEISQAGDGWNLDLFGRDLFLDELIQSCFTITIEGVRFPIHQAYLYQVLSDPPTTVEAIRFRQQIFRELDGDEALYGHVQKLYRELTQLLSMFKAPDHAAKLDINAFRLDTLKQARGVIDWMVEGFGESGSGLHRLHEVGREIQQMPAYGILTDLLDYESRLGQLKVHLGVGGDGEIKHLEILEASENTDNRFYRSPLRRLLLRLKIFLFYGYRLDRKEIVNRLLSEVFRRISPILPPLVQLIGQLEFYLSGLSFRRRVAAQGLETCLAQFDDQRPLELVEVFNPLLLSTDAPVPCTVRSQNPQAITVITGPNSGGKTRLLQTIGLTQLLGQSGLYVTAAEARLPLLRGMFVSLVETETADQAEGRLGRELMRIRSLFETVGTPSMVVLDELCSGTNPAEGTEIIALVLRLLDRLGTRAFISTHFLDFARELNDSPPVPSLEFLRVESRDDLSSTYQFVPGVAETSLAAATAERLGVTFDELAELIDSRRTSPRPVD